MTASKVLTYVSLAIAGLALASTVNVLVWEYFSQPAVKEVVIEVMTAEKQNKHGSVRSMYADEESMSKENVVDSLVNTARNVRMLMKILGVYGDMLEQEKGTVIIGLRIKDGSLQYIHTDSKTYRPQFVDSCDCYKFLNNKVELERTK